jgi:hypothetical protein
VAAPWVLERIKADKSRPKENLGESNLVVEEGSRDLYLISYCGQKIAQGLTEQEVYLLTLARNEEVCKPPLTDDELFPVIDFALKKYAKPGLSGNHFNPKVYAHALMMNYRPITYRGITFKPTPNRNNYEIWDTQDIKRETYKLSESTLTPKQINVVVDLLRLESHVENLAEVPGAKEKDFVRDCLEPNTDGRTYLREIYNSYKKWCRNNRFTPISQADLRKLLECELDVSARRLTGGAYGFNGIQIRKNLPAVRLS